MLLTSKAESAAAAINQQLASFFLAALPSILTFENVEDRWTASQCQTGSGFGHLNVQVKVLPSIEES